MTGQEPELIVREFAGEFVQAMLGAVTRSVGRSWRALSVHSYLGESRAELVWVCLAFSGSIDGTCVLGFSKTDVDALLAGIQRLEKREANLGGEGDGLADAFSSVAPELSAAARSAYGNFTLSVSAQSEPSLNQHSSITIQLHDDCSRSINVVVCVAPALVESLVRSAQAQEREGSDHGDTAEISNENLSMRAPNLDLLMDVELDVTLRFGQRHLTLREVLDLTSGSVIELDRQVEEPVELILDGKVIARGEAVVIDGNYGLRVTEVPQPLTSRQLRI